MAGAKNDFSLLFSLIIHQTKWPEIIYIVYKMFEICLKPYFEKIWSLLQWWNNFYEKFHCRNSWWCDIHLKLTWEVGRSCPLSRISLLFSSFLVKFSVKFSEPGSRCIVKEAPLIYSTSSATSTSSSLSELNSSLSRSFASSPNSLVDGEVEFSSAIKNI